MSVNWEGGKRGTTCSSGALADGDLYLDRSIGKYLIEDEETGHPVETTWDELAEVNDPETMEEIALLQVGQQATLGQCDLIERIA